MSFIKTYSFAKNRLKGELRLHFPVIKSFLFCLRLFIDVSLLTVRVCFTNPRGTVLLCLDSPASMGGTELQVNLIAAQLKKIDLKPLVLTTGALPDRRTSEFFRRLKQEGIEHLRLGNVGLAKHALFQKYRIILLKRLQASFCHCFNPLSTLLISAAKKAGLKIIYSETGLPKKDLWWEPLFSHIEQIESATAVSAASLSRLRSELDYKGPATILYSLIDPPPLHLRARSPVVGELKVVYFGRMHVNKGVHLLLNAFKRLLFIYPKAHLTFIGEGLARRDLEREVIHSKIGGNVFFSHFKIGNEFYEQISHFDLMCLPSFSEGTPCSILEALSIGLAVLSTHVGGIPELIEDGVSGILVPPHDETALVQALARFAKDTSFRWQTAENGFQRFRNHFSPEHHLPELLSLYSGGI